MVFWNSAGFSPVFCQCKCSLPPRRYYSVFGHVGRDLPETHTQPATYCALCSTTIEGSEKSRMRTTYQKKQYEIQGFFAHALFLPKNPKSYGYFWQCKRCSKNPGSLYFGFCQCKWAFCGNWRVNPLTQNVHKTWSYDISYHNSWYRSRKIKEDSSTEREKSPLQFEPIFITVQMYESIAGFFFNENDQEIFKLTTLLMIENPLFLMQIGNVWPKKSYIFLFIFYL